MMALSDSVFYVSRYSMFSSIVEHKVLKQCQLLNVGKTCVTGQFQTSSFTCTPLSPFDTSVAICSKLLSIMASTFFSSTITA